jgi:hypothetical protein
VLLPIIPSQAEATVGTKAVENRPKTAAKKVASKKAKKASAKRRVGKAKRAHRR